jgi:hypothetical protein
MKQKEFSGIFGNRTKFAKRKKNTLLSGATVSLKAGRGILKRLTMTNRITGWKKGCTSQGLDYRVELLILINRGL